MNIIKYDHVTKERIGVKRLLPTYESINDQTSKYSNYVLTTEQSS